MFDYRRCGLPPLEEALCQYALRLTLAPQSMQARDVDRLRQHGLDDHQITIATQVISYFNYINRIADGLGVDSEPWMTLSPEQWLQEKPDWRQLLDRNG